MSACARCGLELSSTYYDAEDMTECLDRLACSQRELANLRSLLRSVTGKLEGAAEALSDLDEELAGRPAYMVAVGAINSVLEVLS